MTDTAVIAVDHDAVTIALDGQTRRRRSTHTTSKEQDMGKRSIIDTTLTSEYRPYEHIEDTTAPQYEHGVLLAGTRIVMYWDDEPSNPGYYGEIRCPVAGVPGSYEPEGIQLDATTDEDATDEFVGWLNTLTTYDLAHDAGDPASIRDLLHV